MFLVAVIRTKLEELDLAGGMSRWTTRDLPVDEAGDTYFLFSDQQYEIVRFPDTDTAIRFFHNPPCADDRGLYLSLFRPSLIAIPDRTTWEKMPAKKPNPVWIVTAQASIWGLTASPLACTLWEKGLKFSSLVPP